jgi:hypothetical protein
MWTWIAATRTLAFDRSSIPRSTPSTTIWCWIMSADES